jgi:hypothetical protein
VLALHALLERAAGHVAVRLVDFNWLSFFGGREDALGEPDGSSDGERSARAHLQCGLDDRSSRAPG